MTTATTQKVISPIQRAQNFAVATRQNKQALGSLAVVNGGDFSIALPKTKLLKKVSLLVQATLTATHATLTAYTPAAAAPFSLLKRLSLDINNGFSPYKIEGVDAYINAYLEQSAAAVIARAGSGRTPNIMPLVCSPGGTANAIKFLIEMPVTINDRDPIGLVLLQNEETIVTLNGTVGTDADIAPASAGFTFVLSGITIIPQIESFSVPAATDAYPDISILKLVQTQSEAIAGAGSKTIKMLTGNTYRRLAIFLSDAAGVGLADSAIAGNFELNFNQADTPYKVNPTILAMENAKQFGAPLPQGWYVFDFAYQGIVNLGGTRDYVDTERLAEFWFTFNAPAAGTVKITAETLTKLRNI